MFCVQCVKESTMQFARSRASLLTDALTAPLGPDALCTPEQPPMAPDDPTAHMQLPCSVVPDDDSLLHVVLALHDTYCALHGPINRVLGHPNAHALVQRIMKLRRAFVKSCRAVDKAAYALRYASNGGAAPQDKVDALQALQIAACAQAAELSQLCTVSPVVALRHCIAAVYDFGLYFTDFSSGGVLGAVDRQGVVPGPIAADTFKALRAGVVEAQGACSAVDHVSVFFDGYAVAGGGSPGLPPLLRFLRWQCAHLCEPSSYIPPWRWHHAGEAPATGGAQSASSTFSPSSVLTDAAMGGQGGLAGIKPPYGMRPRGWSAVEGALSQAHTASGLLSPGAESDPEAIDLPAQHAALQRAHTLLQRGVQGGLCAVPKAAGYWWGCAIPQRCLDDTPQEGAAPPSSPSAGPSTPRRSTHSSTAGEGMFSPPKARLDAAGFTPGLVYGRKPAAGCPPAFTSAAAAGGSAGNTGGVQPVPPTFHPLRAPPVSATFLASLGPALGTARAYAAAIAPQRAPEMGGGYGALSDVLLPPALPSVLRAGGVGPGMPWILTPGADKHDMVDVEGATMPSTPPRQGYMDAPTPRRSTLSTASSPVPPPLQLSGAALKSTPPDAPRSAQRRASYQLNRFGPGTRSSGSRSLQVSQSEVRPAASVQVPRLWCPALFLDPPCTPMSPPSSMALLPSHRAFMIQVGNVTALVLVDLRKLLQGHPAGDSPLWQQTLQDVVPGPSAHELLEGGMPQERTAAQASGRRGSLTPAMVHGTHPASAAVAAASAAAMRGAGAADQALQECADTPERNTLGWRLLRWAVRVVHARLEPVLRRQHTALAAPFDSKSSSTPLHMVYPGIDSDVATGSAASPGLVRFGGGLGPALGVSQRSTHGVVDSAAVYNQIPRHLLAPLHALHSDMAAPSARSFLDGPPSGETGAFGQEQAGGSSAAQRATPHVREGLIATRNMGMIASRSERGLGTAHVVFRKTPSTSVASGHAETILRGTASRGLY